MLFSSWKSMLKISFIASFFRDEIVIRTIIQHSRKSTRFIPKSIHTFFWRRSYSKASKGIDFRNNFSSWKTCINIFLWFRSCWMQNQILNITKILAEWIWWFFLLVKWFYCKHCDERSKRVIDLLIYGFLVVIFSESFFIVKKLVIFYFEVIILYA